MFSDVSIFATTREHDNWSGKYKLTSVLHNHKVLGSRVQTEQEQSLFSNISVPRLFFVTPSLSLSHTQQICWDFSSAHTLSLCLLFPHVTVETHSLLSILSRLKWRPGTTPTHLGNLCCISSLCVCVCWSIVWWCYLYVLSLLNKNNLSLPLTEFCTVMSPHLAFTLKFKLYRHNNNAASCFTELHGNRLLMSTKTTFSLVKASLFWDFSFSLSYVIE